MGSWVAGVYTPEQQRRLGVDENGNPQPARVELPADLEADLEFLQTEVGKQANVQKHGLHFIPGFLASGNDHIHIRGTLEEAAGICARDTKDVIGFTWNGPANPGADEIDIYIKNKSCESKVFGGTESGWFSFIGKPVLYGRPSRDAIAAAEREEVILAGCDMVMDEPILYVLPPKPYQAAPQEEMLGGDPRTWGPPPQEQMQEPQTCTGFGGQGPFTLTVNKMTRGGTQTVEIQVSPFDNVGEVINRLEPSFEADLRHHGSFNNEPKDLCLIDVGISQPMEVDLQISCMMKGPPPC
jgi:hypothetical protein